MKKLIVFATLFEAQSTLDLLQASQIDRHLFTFSQGWIIVTGVGAYAAQQHVTVTLLKQHTIEEIWNFGFAGALRDHHSLGNCVEIHQIGKNITAPHLDVESMRMLPPVFFLSDTKVPALLTVDFPLHNKQERDILKKSWDLVDMEGYGIAYAAQFFNKPCRVWKIVSDFASEGGGDMIRQNGQTLSISIAQQIFKLLE